jgi:multidrug resistance efflux pump
MKHTIFFIFSLVFLASCERASELEETLSGTGAEKTPFIIKIEKLSDFSPSTTVEKSGRISASSSLTLTSKGAGEIGKLLVKEGQYIRAWATIAILKDTVNNFDLRLDQAENALIQQNASIATTEANMNSSLDAARIALERARLGYESATSRKNIEQLTLTTTNLKTVESHTILYKNYLSDLERQMTQMLYSGDKILGVTTTFEWVNDTWEDYLWVRAWDSKSLATNEWNATYTTRGELRARIAKGVYITAWTATADLTYVSDSYEKLIEFADAMLYMLQNNVIGAWLSQEMQAAWIGEWNGIRSQIQASVSGYSGWKAQVLAFLKTYEGTEKATELAIASLSRKLTSTEEAILAGSSDMRVTYERSRIALRESIEGARLSVEQAQSAYDNAAKIKSATLSQLAATRDNAHITLAQARRDYAKLSISAPVEWTITKLRTSVGDTINIGTPIADFAGKRPEIVLDIDPELAQSLWVGDMVEILLGERRLEGTISALSRVAWANLLSSIRIIVEDGEKYIWQSVNVKFHLVGTLDGKRTILPIDAIKILSEWEWEIACLTEDTTIIKKTVKIENIWGQNVEISWDLSSGDRVIISDISNFDPEKHTIEIQQTPSK